MKNGASSTAKGRFLVRVRSTIFLLPALFAPHARLRVFFHRLRGVHIGKNVEVGYGCYLGGVRPSHIHIEDNVTIAGPSVVLDHDNAYHYTFGGPVVHGDVHVRKGSFIGMQSVVYPGVEIGPRAIVGALSFVKSDVPADCIAAGQPARVRRFVTPSQRSDDPGAAEALCETGPGAARITATRQNTIEIEQYTQKSPATGKPPLIRQVLSRWLAGTRSDLR